MPNRKHLGLVLAFVTLMPAGASAEGPAAADEWLASTLRYYGLAERASAGDRDRLNTLRAKALEPSLALRDRIQVFTELYTQLARLSGVADVPRQSVLQACYPAAIASHMVATGGPAIPAPSPATPLGRLGPVKSAGHGPVPLVLIADYGTDWTLYRSFMERNADRYTMVAVTLPGFGGSAAPPRPAVLDLAKTPWFDGAERGVLDLIETAKLDRPFVLGTQVGAYLALRLALDHPDRVRGVVALNGLVSMPMRASDTADAPISHADRRREVARRPEISGLLQEFLPAAIPSRAAAERTFDQLPDRVKEFLANYNTRDVVLGRELYLDFSTKAVPLVFRYLTELNATDLTDALGRLSVPALVLPSVQDDAGPSKDGPGLAQWTEIALRYPRIPLSIVPFVDTRPYAVYDAPEDLDRAVASFVDGRPVLCTRQPVLAQRPSPRASVSQVMGTTEIRIEYGRPRASESESPATLAASFGRVWRAGANEATRIAFSTDVSVEGRPVRAGVYSLFMIPGPDAWTVILNRVADQWGAFAYNPEFDALRITVAPVDAEFQEWLTYGIDLTSPEAATLQLRWGRLKIPVRIEKASG